MPQSIVTTKAISDDLSDVLLATERNGTVAHLLGDRINARGTFHPMSHGKLIPFTSTDIDGREIAVIELTDSLVSLGDFNEQRALFRHREDHDRTLAIPSTHDGLYYFSDSFQTPVLQIIVVDGLVSELASINWSVESLFAYHSEYLAGVPFPQGYVHPIIAVVPDGLIEHAMKSDGIVNKLLGDELFNEVKHAFNPEADFLISRLVGAVYGYARLTKRPGTIDRSFDEIANSAVVAPTRNGGESISLHLRHRLGQEGSAYGHEGRLSDVLSQGMATFKSSIQRVCEIERDFQISIVPRGREVLERSELVMLPKMAKE